VLLRAALFDAFNLYDRVNARELREPVVPVRGRLGHCRTKCFERCLDFEFEWPARADEQSVP